LRYFYFGTSVAGSEAHPATPKDEEDILSDSVLTYTIGGFGFWANFCSNIAISCSSSYFSC
jgi:hypothetical protein